MAWRTRIRSSSRPRAVLTPVCEHGQVVGELGGGFVAPGGGDVAVGVAGRPQRGPHQLDRPAPGQAVEPPLAMLGGRRVGLSTPGCARRKTS